MTIFYFEYLEYGDSGVAELAWCDHCGGNKECAMIVPKGTNVCPWCGSEFDKHEEVDMESIMTMNRVIFVSKPPMNGCT